MRSGGLGSCPNGGLGGGGGWRGGPPTREEAKAAVSCFFSSLIDLGTRANKEGFRLREERRLMASGSGAGVCDLLASPVGLVLGFELLNVADRAREPSKFIDELLESVSEEVGSVRVSAEFSEVLRVAGPVGALFVSTPHPDVARGFGHALEALGFGAPRERAIFDDESVSGFEFVADGFAHVLRVLIPFRRRAGAPSERFPSDNLLLLGMRELLTVFIQVK